MPKFSKQSKENLLSCDTRLQDIMNTAIKYIDFSIVKGFRSEIEQNKAYVNNYSKVKYPNSKHNSIPSKAVDIQPYPYPVKRVTNQFTYLAGHILMVAHNLGYKIRWGGDWNLNQNVTDNNFNDLYHFEIIE